MANGIVVVTDLPQSGNIELMLNGVVVIRKALQGNTGLSLGGLLGIPASTTRSRMAAAEKRFALALSRNGVTVHG